MSLKAPYTWLAHQKAIDLRNIAVLGGIASSGTKELLIQNIQNALLALPRTTPGRKAWLPKPRKALSVVSIDMGIRNLAYTHWTTSLKKPRSDAVTLYDRPRLTAWRKIDISKTNHSTTVTNDTEPAVVNGKRDSKKKNRSLKESFEPHEYASHAYVLIKSILEEHKPSHVTIERQRFRSGSLSAVQEWTIRVGVFEGMLYAVLKTLAAEHSDYAELLVEPVLPIRVNNYWSDIAVCSGVINSNRLGGKKSSREVKQAKIGLVKELLGLSGSRDRALSSDSKPWFLIDNGAADMASAFLASKNSLRRKSSTRSVNLDGTTPMSSEISKLDDLADSFLQGLAWLHWQNNHLRLAQIPEGTIPLPTGWNLAS